MDGILEIFEASALAAGKAILVIRDRGAQARLKADCSPITEADEAAEAIILAALTQHFPDIPCVAEEAVAAGITPDALGTRFFLVDPLDGTKEFVAGREDFTVNIALIENGEPVAGFIYAPALKVAYAGIRHDGTGHAMKMTVTVNSEIAGRRKIACREMQVPPVALASRSHRCRQTEDFLLRCGATETRSIGSSLKFCLLAEGLADIYPRFTRTMEWDTAAGDAILRAAGGRTLDIHGNPLAYGKRNQADEADFANREFISEGALPGRR